MRARLSDMHRDALLGQKSMPPHVKINPSRSLLHDRPVKSLRRSVDGDAAVVPLPIPGQVVSPRRKRPSGRSSRRSSPHLSSQSSVTTSDADAATPSLDSGRWGSRSSFLSEVQSEENNSSSRHGSFKSNGADPNDDDASLEEGDEGSACEEVLSESSDEIVFWERANRRWRRKFHLQFNDCAIRSALLAAVESGNVVRKAMAQLDDLAGFFFKLGRPVVNLSDQMKRFVTKDHLLYFDPNVLRDSSKRGILFMQPGR